MNIRRKDGFALPLTIFVISILTLMLTAVFVRVSVDRRVAQSSGDMVHALTVAQCGLYRALDTWSGNVTPPNDGDSLFVNATFCPGGNATVTAHLVKNPPDSLDAQVYVIRSTGRSIIPTLGSEPQATRTVAQFALWQTGTMELLAAFTAAHGLEVAGAGTIDIDGSDGCSTLPTTAGVRVPVGGPGLPGPPTIDGLPPIDQNDNEAVVAAQTKIDWTAITTGGFWGDYSSLQLGDMTFPTQVITGDLIRATSTIGSGLLIVTGDLELGGVLTLWNGIILVGGEARFNSDFSFIYGQVTTGLNRIVGINPPRGDIGTNGTNLTIRYHSCNVDSALAALTGFVAVPNTWIDNWATY
jgi:hypothetical protein